jgi:hypothetical protein
MNMALNTLGKSLVTGLVGFMGVVSTVFVFMMAFVHGMGQGAYSSSDFGLYQVLSLPAIIGVIPMGLAALATSMVLTAKKANWNYFVLPMVMPWVMPLWLMVAAQAL